MLPRLTSAELKRFRRFLEDALDREESGTPSSEARAIKKQFWAEIRSHLGGNPQSSGLEHLDALAEAVLDEKSGVALQGTVLVLPALPPASSKNPAKSSATKASPQSKRKATGETSAVQAPSKKQRVPGKQKKDAPTPTSVPSPPVSSELFALTPKTPKYVRDAIETVLSKAAAAGKKPWCLAFPWTGSNFWYDPVAFPSIHRAHWRFWMPHRRAFWEWAFHAPLENPASRRKAKLRATVARLAFTSLCIQTWGFYGFMEQLDACPDMYWLGGQPGRTASDGNKYPGPHAEDLASLARKDKPRYQATIKNALTPVAVDAYGYESMRSFLEATDALNPKAEEKYRLSMEALARVRRDIMSSAKSKPAWSGSRNEEPWLTVVNSRNVKLAQEAFQAALAAGTYEIPSAKPITDAERSRDDYSDFEDVDDEEEKASLPKDVEASAVDTSAEQEDTGEAGDDDQDGEEDVGDNDDVEEGEDEEGDPEDEGAEAGVDGE